MATSHPEGRALCLASAACGIQEVIVLADLAPLENRAATHARPQAWHTRSALCLISNVRRVLFVSAQRVPTMSVQNFMVLTAA